MKIFVNATSQNVSQPILAKALQELGFISPAIATSLNGVFVAVAERETAELRENDRLEVLSPMQGG